MGVVPHPPDVPESPDTVVLPPDDVPSIDAPSPPPDVPAFDSPSPSPDATDATTTPRDAPVAHDVPAPTDVPPACTGPAPCTTSCGTTGSRPCTGGVAGACVPPREICNGVDDNCDGRVDEIDCTHAVQCEVFADGYGSPSAMTDAIYIPAAGQACAPTSGGGYCQRWFGRCVALPAADGHTHNVTFSVFDDGYTNLVPPQDAVFVSGATSECVPGGSTGTCRRWFGRGVTDVVQGHSHTVECSVFDDGYTNVAGPADAILWNGSALCVPGGSTGVCRRWFGRCIAR